MATSSRPQKSATTGPQARNLWLAIGDETGSFEDLNSNAFHGVGLILARPQHLQAGIDELIAGKTVSTRMTQAIEGLETYLRTNRIGFDERELRKHHVRIAWKYFQERKLRGTYSLEDSPDDQVLRNLLAAFRWLSGHRQIISTGIGGSGREIFGTFWKGRDPMAALGALYGTTLALLRPFLGDGAQIRFLPGRRSEALNSIIIKRAGQLVASRESDQRDSSCKTGGDRTLLEAAETTFWAMLQPMSHHWPVPQANSARQIAFSAYTEESALVDLLTREDAVAAALIRNHNHVIHNLADLSCSLMSVSHEKNDGVRIKLPAPIGPNVRFFRISEVSQ